jgi:hypothetical protein
MITEDVIVRAGIFGDGEGIFKLFLKLDKNLYQSSVHSKGLGGCLRTIFEVV